MTYKPPLYSEEKPISARTLRNYEYVDVHLEMDNPEDPDGDLIEHSFALYFNFAPAEPDVGIMDAYLDEWWYCEVDGSVLPEAVWNEVQKIGARDEHRKPISPEMEKWHERQIESAMQGDY